MSYRMYRGPQMDSGVPVSDEEDELLRELISLAAEQSPGARFLARRVKNEYGELEAKRHSNLPTPPRPEPPKLAIAA